MKYMADWDAQRRCVKERRGGDEGKSAGLIRGLGMEFTLNDRRIYSCCRSSKAGDGGGHPHYWLILESG